MPNLSQINIPNGDSSVTYNLKDASVPHSSLPAVSGGANLSLVTTGEKADWIDKTKIYQVKGTKRTSTIGDWAGVIDVPALYDGLLMLYLAPEDTYYDDRTGSIALRLTLSDGTITDLETVFGLNLINVCIGHWYLFRYGQSEIVSGWYYVNGLSYDSNAVIQTKASTYILDEREFPILLSQKAIDENTQYVLSKAHFSYPFRYSASAGNLTVPKVNGYTLNNACAKDVDNEVEQSSDNLPTSDAVYNAINNIHIQTKTASGAIATFNDASGDVPFATLKSEINPVQDLHGYSKPWSGGGGKNKINVADKTQQSSGYLFSNYAIELPSGDWTLSFNSTATDGQCAFIVKNGSTNIASKTINLSNGRKSATVTTTQSSTKIECYINTSGTFSNIMLEQGSMATAYEPYSNICPISGFSALNVTRTGKNLFNDTTGTYTINANTDVTTIIGNVYLKANTTYTISCKQTPAPLTSFVRNTLFVVGGGTTTYNPAGNDYTIKPMTFTPTVSGTYSVRVWGHTLSANTTYSEFQVEVGSTATDYSPYNGQTATVNFGQTVYGGEVNVTGGKVTVTKIAHVFDGSENFLTLASGRVFAYDFGVNVANSFDNNNSLCSHFHKGATSWDLLAVGEYLIAGGRYGGVNPDMTLADYKTYLQAQYNNGTPVTLVATLATPIEITTTPENLTAISGENNVYGDTNGDTEVEYFSGDCDGIIKLLKALSVI